MSLFKKFRKKRETSDKKEEISEGGLSEQDAGKKQAVKTADSNESKNIYILNPRLAIKKKTPIYDLWKIYHSSNGLIESFSPLEYIEKTIIRAKEQMGGEEEFNGLDINETELLRFIQEIQKRSEVILNGIKAEKSSASGGDNGGRMNSTPLNAEPFLYMTNNKLRLWIFVFGPLNDGSDVSSEQIRLKIEEMNVRYGVKDEVINKIAENKIYFKIIEIAKGKEAVNGKDGSVKNLYSKTRNKINIKEDVQGNVNYKELNMIQSIHKGDVICQITPPTLSVNGVSVTGEPIKGKDGKPPHIPAGKNTVLSEDKTKLLADIDGEVVYEGNKFNVKNLLTINHDVDNSIGNIDFTGDILIKGDVREGYSVKAEGDVTIFGTVEGATVIAGGDLTIERGMTGGNKGVIETQGILKCRYLENCRVYAKGGIEAEQIMYSALSTDDSIIIKGRKGSVTGGKLIAGRSIEAVSIGTPLNGNLRTEIVLGAVPELIMEEKRIQTHLDDIQDNIFKMAQDIKYLESNIENVNVERKELLKNLKFQYQIMNMQKMKYETSLEKIKRKIQSNTEMCSLKCSNIYPIINLNVCGSLYTLDMELKECSIARKNDKTYIMSPNLKETIVF